MEDSNQLRTGDATRLIMLLALLAAFLVLYPQFEQSALGLIAFRLSMTGIYAGALLANRNRPTIFRIGLGLAVVGSVVIWLEPLVASVEFLIFSGLVGAGLLAMTAVLILINVLTRHTGTYYSIPGVVAVYLLLGMVWVALYRTAELLNADAFEVPHRLTVEPFAGGPQLTATSQLIYFSFVTMSTLGYGDFTPLSPPARTMAWVQSVVGQFYLAIVVAWLIGILPRRDQTMGEPEG